MGKESESRRLRGGERKETGRGTSPHGARRHCRGGRGRASTVVTGVRRGVEGASSCHHQGAITIPCLIDQGPRDAAYRRRC